MRFQEGGVPVTVNNSKIPPFMCQHTIFFRFYEVEGSPRGAGG